jgi:hypothetical protein
MIKNNNISNIISNNNEKDIIISDIIRQKVCSIANTMPGIFDNTYEEYVDENFLLSFLDIISNKLKQQSSNNSKPSSPINKKYNNNSPDREENDFLAKAAAVESDLMLMKHHISDIQLLKTKLQQQQYMVKQSKLDLIEEMSKHDKTKKKVQILTDHVEKLVKILKYESTAKIKGLEHIREMKKDMKRIDNTLKNKSKVIASQSRLIRELREGAKILEDQLRIMDEKFLDVRFKLDGVRTQQKTIVLKAEAEAQALRVKFALSQGKIGRIQTLDSIQLPGTNNSIDFGTNRPIGEEAFNSHIVKSNRPQTASGRIKTNNDEYIRRPTSALPGTKKPNVQKELDDVILKIHRKQKNNQLPWSKERLDILINKQ